MSAAMDLDYREKLSDESSFLDIFAATDRAESEVVSSVKKSFRNQTLDQPHKSNLAGSKRNMKEE